MNTNREIVLALLRELVGSARDARMIEVARRHAALPVYSDWTSTLLLTVDLQCLVFDDESGQVTPASARYTRLALVAAARSFPELAHVLPARPDEALDCGQCHALGYDPSVDLELAPTCGVCMGTGWIDAMADARRVK